MTFKQAVCKAQELYGAETIISHDHAWSNVFHTSKHSYWIFGDSGTILIAASSVSWEDAFRIAAEKESASV